MSKTYDIYVRSSNMRKAVKRGFSWPAFFFVFLWAFYKRLWGFGLALLAVIAVLMLAEKSIEYLNFSGAGFLFTIAHLIVALVVGIVGNDRVKSHLLNLGFKYASSVDVNSISDVVLTDGQ